MGWREVYNEVVGGRYYTRHPIEMARYLVARASISRHWRPDPDLLLANLGIDPQPYLEDLARWQPLFDDISVNRNDYLGFATGVTTGAGQAQYLMVRALKPQTIIETGIASGISTAHLGAALIDNGSGSLFSLELPHLEAATRFAKYGAQMQPDKPPAWALPDEIRHGLGDRLHLVLEDVTAALPRLLDELAPIDLFIHDDLHTPSHMTWEFELVWPRLRSGGVLACDNAEAAWLRFAKRVGAPNGGRDTVGGLAAVRKR